MDSAHDSLDEVDCRVGVGLRGSDERSGALFLYVDLEEWVRRDHPPRVILEIANRALGDLGRARVDAAFTLALTAYNLIRG